MKCPHCEKDLLMTERSGVEIDYCPGYSQQRPMDSDDRDRYDREDRSGYGHGKKRGSFLSNLFDFD